MGLSARAYHACRRLVTGVYTMWTTKCHRGFWTLHTGAQTAFSKPSLLNTLFIIVAPEVLWVIIYKRHYSLDSFFHHVYSYNLIHRIYNIFKNKSIKNDVNKILNKYVIYQSGLESKFYRNTNGVKTWKGLPLGEKLPLNIYWQYRLI